MATHTRYVGQVILQRVVTTDSTETHGFGGSSPKSTEKVYTDLSVGITGDDLTEAITKAAYALNLAYPTKKGDAPDASPSS